MKKLFLTTVFLINIFSTDGFAQAFKKNTFVVNGGAGFGIGFDYRNYNSTTLSTNNGFANDASDDLGFVVGAIFPIAAEYAISNKFGLGVSFQHASYESGNFSKTITTSRSNSFGMFGAFHFARKEKIELYTRLNLGLSYMINIDKLDAYFYSSSANYPSNNLTYTYKLSGGFVKPSFGMRLYFTKNIGMFADFGIGVYSYRTSQVESDQGTYDLQKRAHYVLINGELTTGLAFKF